MIVSSLLLIIIRRVDAIVEMFGQDWLVQRRRSIVELIDLCENVRALHIADVDVALFDADTVRAGEFIRCDA